MNPSPTKNIGIAGKLAGYKIVKVSAWLLLAIGLVLAFLSFSAWFFVPGVVDSSRFVVAGLAASLATNALMLGGIFSYASRENGRNTLKSILVSPPFILAGAVVVSFVMAAAASPWWGRH